MKFLCIGCDEVMAFAERQVPGDGTLAAVFACPRCGHEIAMLTNPMETQLVSSLGVRIGGRAVPEQPMEMTRSTLADARSDVFTESSPHELLVGGMAPHAAAAAAMPAAAPATETVASPALSVTWDGAAQERLAKVPGFVRGMVKRIYADYAKEHGIAVISPEVMDRARTELGLEGM